MNAVCRSALSREFVHVDAVAAADARRDRSRPRACKTEGDGGDDGSNAVKRGTQLLEIFALQILMHSRLRDKKKLRSVRVRACFSRGTGVYL